MVWKTFLQKLLAVLICTLYLPGLMRISEFQCPMEYFYLGLVSKLCDDLIFEVKPVQLTGQGHIFFE